MEFNKDHLGRDWIAGISGEAFVAKVESAASLLDSLSEEERLRGALIAEEDPIEFAAAFFALVMMRIPAVLANPRWAAKEWAELDALVQPAVSFCGGVPHAPPPAVQDTASEAPTPLHPGAILIPTGGTTGGVKLAIHNWGSLSAAVKGLQDFLGGGPIHSACQLPLFHVSGLMQLLRSFLTGGRIHFDDSVLEGDCLSLVPTQLKRALDSEGGIRKINTARVIFVGGATMSKSLAARARGLRLPVVPVYGMTETAAMVAAVPAEDFLNDPESGALPLGDARFMVEADGRIRIQSSALFQGYHGRPSTDLSKGYLVGDAGRLDAERRLHVLGRVDRLINTGGEKVDPREVESALLQLEGVEEARVMGEPDPEWGQIVVALVCGDPGNDPEKLRAQLKKTLSPYKVPKRIRILDAMPEVSKPSLSVGAPLVAPAEPKQAEPKSNAGVTSDAPASELRVRKTHHLYKGRRSMPGLRYFITICTKNRRAGLTDHNVSDAIHAIWRQQHTDGDFTFHCGTVMPDHIHCLFTLGKRLTLGQSLVKFKAKTKSVLIASGIEWQRDFYDHWLRADDAMEGFARYIFLNPYRKSLLAPDATWPHWHLNKDYCPEFLAHLKNGAPPYEWLARDVTVEDLIQLDSETASS